MSKKNATLETSNETDGETSNETASNARTPRTVYTVDMLSAEENDLLQSRVSTAQANRAAIAAMYIPADFVTRGEDGARTHFIVNDLGEVVYMTVQGKNGASTEVFAYVAALTFNENTSSIDAEVYSVDGRSGARGARGIVVPADRVQAICTRKPDDYIEKRELGRIIRARSAERKPSKSRSVKTVSASLEDVL